MAQSLGEGKLSLPPTPAGMDRYGRKGGPSRQVGGAAIVYFPLASDGPGTEVSGVRGVRAPRIEMCVGGRGLAYETSVRVTHREVVARGRAGREGRICGESSGHGGLRQGC